MSTAPLPKKEPVEPPAEPQGEPITLDTDFEETDEAYRRMEEELARPTPKKS